MRIKPTTVTKNGLSYTIRALEPTDAQEALDFMHHLYEESPYLARYADELKLTIEEEMAFIEVNLADEGRLLAGIFVGDRLIGLGSWAAVSKSEKLAHRCTTSIMVDPVHQSRGVGTAMMGALIECARQAGFEQMELEVVSDNSAAIGLYEKLGFAKCGLLERGFRNRDGSYHDLLAMVLIL